MVPGEDEERTGRVKLVQDTDRLGEYLVTEGPISLRVRVENAPCWLRVIVDGERKRPSNRGLRGNLPPNKNSASGRGIPAALS